MVKKPPKSMAISEFKATCLSVLEQVRRTGTPVVVTKRGIPIAEVVPLSLATAGSDWIDSMRGTATLNDDLIAPASSPGDWEVLGT